MVFGETTCFCSKYNITSSNSWSRHCTDYTTAAFFMFSWDEWFIAAFSVYFLAFHGHPTDDYRLPSCDANEVALNAWGNISRNVGACLSQYSFMMLTSHKTTKVKLDNVFWCTQSANVWNIIVRVATGRVCVGLDGHTEIICLWSDWAESPHHDASTTWQVSGAKEIE